MKIKNRAIVTLALTATAVLTACSAPASPRPLPQPPDGSQVAGIVHATGYHDLGPSALAGVTDHGTAMYNGRKVGIDTFATSDALATWLTTASKFGVVPLFRGATWVAYWSVN